MGKKLKFSFFWPTLYKPLARFLWFHAKMCGVLLLLYPTYVTGLDDAQENRNARWPSCNTQNRQNWYCVTHVLTHPVETP